MTTPIGRCSRGCDAAFTGKHNHCTQCHQTFASERGGDSHRIGPYHPPGQRRCRTPDELRAGGMWATFNTHGTLIWHGEYNNKGEQKRRPRI